MRRKWTTVSALACCLTVLCGLVAACGGAEGVSGGVALRFSWWGNEGRAKATEKAIAAFRRTHPGITVQTSFSSYEPYKQKLATQAAGGDAPDVMQLDYRQISQYAGSGILLDLAKRPELRRDQMDPALLRTGQLGGVQYAVPMARGTQAIAYDSTLWAKAGAAEPAATWTWDDWAAAWRKVAAATGKAGSTDPGYSEDWFEVWLRGKGKALYDGGGIAFTDEDLAEFWQWCTTLRREGAVSSARQTTQMDGALDNTPMGRGNAVSDPSWDAASSGYKSLVGDSVRIAPMPVGPDGKPGQYFKPAMLIGVSARSPHPAEAAMLIDFLLNDPGAGEVLGVSRGIPVNDGVRAKVDPGLKGFDRRIADLQKGLEGRLALPPPAPPKGDNTLQSTFQRDYDQVSFERMSPLEAARDYLTEAAAELKQ